MRIRKIEGGRVLIPESDEDLATLERMRRSGRLDSGMEERLHPEPTSPSDNLKAD